MDWLQAHRFAAACTLVALAVGCSAYDHRYEYQPGPVDVEAAIPGAPDAEPIRVLVSVMGVRKADSKLQLPTSVEVRLRVENFSGTDAVLDPATLVLFSADLRQFPDPFVVPGEPVELPPLESMVINAFFPFPEGKVPGKFDLNGLNVRWTLRIGGRSVTSSASFSRLPVVYYDRYPNRIGVGYQRYDC